MSNATQFLGKPAVDVATTKARKAVYNKLSDSASSSFPVFRTDVSGQRRCQLKVCLSNMSIKSPQRRDVRPQLFCTPLRKAFQNWQTVVFNTLTKAWSCSPGGDPHQDGLTKSHRKATLILCQDVSSIRGPGQKMSTAGAVQLKAPSVTLCSPCSGLVFMTCSLRLISFCWNVCSFLAFASLQTACKFCVHT